VKIESPVVVRLGRDGSGCYVEGYVSLWLVAASVLAAASVALIRLVLR